MTDRNAIMEKTLAKLRPIQTLNEFKAARGDITDLIGQIMVSATDAMKEYLEKSGSMPLEERQAEAAKFINENFLISAEVMQEVDRLNNLPGGGKYAESFSLELEKVMEPHIIEFEELMGRLMEGFADGIIEGMTGETT